MLLEYDYCPMLGTGEMNGFLKLFATGPQKTDQKKRSAGEKR